jgi:hypothetical protein
VKSKLTLNLSEQEKFSKIMKDFIYGNPLNYILGSYNFTANLWGVDFGGCWKTESFTNENVTSGELFTKCETDICCIEFYHHYLTECDEPSLHLLTRKSNSEDYLCPPLSNCQLMCGEINE